MSVVLLTKKVTKGEFKKAREVYSDYIKTVIDVSKGVLAIGGEYHIDCEEVLIASGSKQEDLYGGGYRISTGEVEYMAMSNYKPSLGRMTYEVSDPKTRDIMMKVAKKLLII